MSFGLGTLTLYGYRCQEVQLQPLNNTSFSSKTSTSPTPMVPPTPETLLVRVTLKPGCPRSSVERGNLEGGRSVGTGRPRFFLSVCRSPSLHEGPLDEKPGNRTYHTSLEHDQCHLGSPTVFREEDPWLCALPSPGVCLDGRCEQPAPPETASTSSHDSSLITPTPSWRFEHFDQPHPRRLTHPADDRPIIPRR